MNNAKRMCESASASAACDGRLSGRRRRAVLVSVRRYGSSECGRGRTRAVTARSVQYHCAFVLEERNGGEGGVGEG